MVVEFDIAALPRDKVYGLLVGSVLPRPIAWVSTLDGNGVANLAPFSFFTVASVAPPVLAISILNPASGGVKDTLANARITGELVVNVVTEALAEAMNACCGEYAPEVDEFALAGLAKSASRRVRAPGVAAAPVRMECRLREVLNFGADPGAGNLLLAEVIHLHVDEAVLREGRIDPELLRAVGKLGGDGYSRAQNAFSLRRP